MKSKHTPGPWTFSQNHFGNICLNGKPISEADSRLIASAPELLKAALFILKEVTELPGTGKQDGNIGHRHINALKAAVAKATGGES